MGPEASQPFLVRPLAGWACRVDDIVPALAFSLYLPHQGKGMGTLNLSVEECPYLALMRTEEGVTRQRLWDILTLHHRIKARASSRPPSTNSPRPLQNPPTTATRSRQTPCASTGTPDLTYITTLPVLNRRTRWTAGSSRTPPRLRSTTVSRPISMMPLPTPGLRPRTEGLFG